jgi:hypothetical protein
MHLSKAALERIKFLLDESRPAKADAILSIRIPRSVLAELDEAVAAYAGSVTRNKLVGVLLATALEHLKATREKEVDDDRPLRERAAARPMGHARAK